MAKKQQPPKKKNPKKKLDTLLTRFIDCKVKIYKEPQRKGTPRGESVGFSKKKYIASLFLITKLDLQSLAESLDISYGLLRKWRTEDAFKKTIEQHAIDFFISIRTFIIDRLYDAYKHPEKHKNKSMPSSNDLGDTNTYGTPIINVMWGYVTNYFGGIDEIIDSGEAQVKEYLFREFIIDYFLLDKKGFPAKEKARRKLIIDSPDKLKSQKDLMKYLIEEGEKILNKNSINKEDRLRLRGIFSNLSMGLDHYDNEINVDDKN